jgi:hypothetical protein
MSEDWYNKFVNTKIKYPTPVDRSYKLENELGGKNITNTISHLDRSRYNELCSNDLCKTEEEKIYFPRLMVSDIFGFSSPLVQTVYYELTAYIATFDAKNVTKFFTRSVIEEMSDSELFSKIFRLSFDERKYVDDGYEKSQKVIFCNTALGAHWCYNYLISKGFTVAKKNNYYILEHDKIKTTTAIANNNNTKVTDLINIYIDHIKTKFNVQDASQQAYDQRIYGKGVDINMLLQLLNNDSNIQAIRNSIISYMEWKRKKYNEKLRAFRDEMEKQEEVFARAKLSQEERKEMGGSNATTKIIIANLSYVIESVDNKIKELKNVDLYVLKNNYIDAVTNDKNGLITILDISIVNNVSNIISTLIRGYQAFSTSFQNILITGSAGTGKSTLAYKLSYIYRKLGILCTDIVLIKTRSDLVGNYLGQTAPKTNKVLIDALEGILFIDEAYQIGGCPTPDQYGAESLTEIVNFLDKNIGISIVIVAGYQKEMEECFFARNEGLRRRFPTKYDMKPFNSLQLTKVFLTKVFESLDFNPFDYKTIELTYTIIDNLRKSNYVPNMGGDMLILASNFIVGYLSSGDVASSLLNASYIYCTRDHDENTCNTFTNANRV